MSDGEEDEARTEGEDDASRRRAFRLAGGALFVAITLGALAFTLLAGEAPPPSEPPIAAALPAPTRTPEAPPVVDDAHHAHHAHEAQERGAGGARRRTSRQPKRRPRTASVAPAPPKEPPRSTKRTAASRRVQTALAAVRDVSKSGLPGLAGALRRHLVASFEARSSRAVRLVSGSVDEGYTLAAYVKAVRTRREGGATSVEVDCALTASRVPGGGLRLGARASAAAALEGEADAAARTELAREALKACARGLAQDYVEYAAKQR